MEVVAFAAFVELSAVAVTSSSSSPSPFGTPGTGTAKKGLSMLETARRALASRGLNVTDLTRDEDGEQDEDVVQQKVARSGSARAMLVHDIIEIVRPPLFHILCGLRLIRMMWV